MKARRFRRQYNLLVRRLKGTKEMTFGELCMLWNVGPDRARRLVKSMSQIDRHIKISEDGIEWEDEPYRDISDNLKFKESKENGLKSNAHSNIEKEEQPYKAYSPKNL